MDAHQSVICKALVFEVIFFFPSLVLNKKESLKSILYFIY